MRDECEFSMGRCPFREGQESMSAADWLRTYTDWERYLDIESEEQLWLLAEAMTDDARDSAVAIDVIEMFEELRKR